MVDLSSFDDMYEKAVPPERDGFDYPPDGRYQVTVEKLELDEVGADKKPVLRWLLRIIAGNHVGKAIPRSMFITLKAVEFVKKDLSLLGFAGKLSELNQPEVRMSFISKCMEVAVQRKGEYNGEPNVNVYFNKVIDVSPPVASSGATADANKPPF